MSNKNHSYKSRAHQINVKRCDRPQQWTKEEDELLRKYYKKRLHTRGVAAIIHRTKAAIDARARKLGLIYEQSIEPSCVPSEFVCNLED